MGWSIWTDFRVGEPRGQKFKEIKVLEKGGWGSDAEVRALCPGRASGGHAYSHWPICGLVVYWIRLYRKIPLMITPTEKDVRPRPLRISGGYKIKVCFLASMAAGSPQCDDTGTDPFLSCAAAGPDSLTFPCGARGEAIKHTGSEGRMQTADRVSAHSPGVRTQSLVPL